MAVVNKLFSKIFSQDVIQLKPYAKVEFVWYLERYTLKKKIILVINKIYLLKHISKCVLNHLNCS